MITSNLSELTIHEEIGIITICNSKKNHITIPEFVELNVLDNFINTNKLKAIIITGRSKHFSHGADFNLISCSSNNLSDLKDKLTLGKALLDYIENLPIITVAAVNGACFGAGLEIALSCQFRIASEKAFLGLPESNLNIIPGMDGIKRLAKLLTKQQAIQLSITGNIISSSDSFEIGLVDKIADPCLDESIIFINEIIAQKSLKQINAIISTINSTINHQEISDDSFLEFVKDLSK